MSGAPPAKRLIRVLVAESSARARELFVQALRSDPEVEVVAALDASAGAVASTATRLRPDVILMGIDESRTGELETIQRIMRETPTPIVAATSSGSSAPEETSLSFMAIQAGAVALAPRPSELSQPNRDAQVKSLLRAVKAMAEVKVVRRWARREKTPAPLSEDAATPPSSAALRAAGRLSEEIEIAVIGASTGGPLALQAILSRLPANLPFPVAIVQHMAPGFAEGFAEWLSRSTNFPTSVAVGGETMRPGRAYIAPDGCHMAVDAFRRVSLSSEPPEGGLRPAVAHLFRSVARTSGRKSIAALLTGMGVDGAAELKALRDLGALTVAQDKASSVVHGMPGEAIRLQGAVRVLPPDAIAEFIVANGGRGRETARSD